MGRGSLLLYEIIIYILLFCTKLWIRHCQICTFIRTRERFNTQTQFTVLFKQLLFLNKNGKYFQTENIASFSVKLGSQGGGGGCQLTVWMKMILPPTNGVWGKVMFFHLSVILVTGGGVFQHAMGQGVW